MSTLKAKPTLQSRVTQEVVVVQSVITALYLHTATRKPGTNRESQQFQNHNLYGGEHRDARL